jgi:peptidoglycan/xylan/chitin deacetylase (PgdA/CDA1 family)
VRAILTYHSIDDSRSPISVDRGTFDRHLDWLGSGRVRVVPLDQLAADPSPDAIAVTFDDGFRNFGVHVAPRALERGVPITVFVVSDHAGRSNAWGGRRPAGIPDLELLGWEEIGRLAEAGIAIGSHTRRHPRLTQLSPEEVEDELEGSAERIRSELGQRPRWLAYPYGAVNRAVADRARKHYAGAVTTEYRGVTPSDDPIQLPRLDAWYFRRPDAFARWGTAGFRRSIWARRQARRARAALRGLGGGE